ncbi:hypothetical protein RMSM_02870, partial [Rhodopirellula maiorica SM1]
MTPFACILEQQWFGFVAKRVFFIARMSMPRTFTQSQVPACGPVVTNKVKLWPCAFQTRKHLDAYTYHVSRFAD